MNEVLVFSNRNITNRENPLECFGDQYHPDGSDHLEVALFSRDGRRSWSVRFLNPEEVEEAFVEMVSRIQSLIFYVHGYNTPWKNCLTTCETLGDVYQSRVVAFTWPSVGKMQLSAYKVDKLRAKTSAKALDSVFTRIHGIFQRNKELQDRLTTNVLLFSMGAYAFKHVVDQSFLSAGSDRDADSSIKVINEVANNILMVAADVNNPGHEDWCDKLSPRNGSSYITINESDLALSLSEMLFPGPEQMARLGNSNFNLKSRKITYLNVTSSSHLGNMHRYFEGNQPVLKDVFSLIFSGKSPLEDRNITFLTRDDFPQAYNLRYCPYC